MGLPDGKNAELALVVDDDRVERQALARSAAEITEGNVVDSDEVLAGLCE